MKNVATFIFIVVLDLAIMYIVADNLAIKTQKKNIECENRMNALIERFDSTNRHPIEKINEKLELINGKLK